LTHFIQNTPRVSKTSEVVFLAIADLAWNERYHWALLVGPKTESEGDRGTRYHAKERLVAEGQMTWIFEEVFVSLQTNNILLVRIMIGKIGKAEHLVDTLRKIPIKQSEPNWNCVFWAKEALEAFQADSKILGTYVTD
jgi:hypothetical protein